MKEYNGTHYSDSTPDELIRAIDNAMQLRKRVKVYYGDQQTGSDYIEECDKYGRIGRSTGSKKIPLLIRNSRSCGGPALMESSIVKLVCTNTGRTLWIHPNYQAPVFELCTSDLPEYTHNVKVNGQLYSRHRSEKSAKALISKLS